MSSVVVDISYLIKKKTPTKLTRIARIAALSLLAVRIVVVVLNCCGIALMIGSLSQTYITLVADAILLLSAIFSINLRKPKLARILLSAVLAILIFIAFNSISFYQSSRTVYKYESPNAKNTLLISDTTSVFSSKINFYKKLNPIMIKKLNSVETTEGVKPMVDNTAEIIWKSDIQAVYKYTVNSHNNDILLNF